MEILAQNFGFPLAEKPHIIEPIIDSWFNEAMMEWWVGVDDSVSPSVVTHVRRASPNPLTSD